MNFRFFALGVLFSAPALAQTAPAYEPPPPTIPGRQVPEAPARLLENQRLYGPTAEAQRPLVAPEVAQRLLERFRQAFSAPTAPRLVLYVNRELVSGTPGMNLTGRTESYARTEQGVDITLKSKGTNTYEAKEEATPTLADRQTVREVERLFGRVFRNADARLADQTVAVALLPDEPGRRLVGESAARDREALLQVADIAVEVLITSRELPVSMISGDQLVPVPDIQVTAIRLKDAAIVGQASAADVLGKGADAGRRARQYGIQEITEATALALMEDMLIGAK